MASASEIWLWIALVLCLAILSAITVSCVQFTTSGGTEWYIVCVVGASFLLGCLVSWIASRIRAQRAQCLQALQTQGASKDLQSRSFSEVSEKIAAESEVVTAQEDLQKSLFVGNAPSQFFFHASEGFTHNKTHAHGFGRMSTGPAVFNFEEKTKKAQEPKSALDSIPKGAVMMNPSLRKVTLAAALLQILQGEGDITNAGNQTDSSPSTREGTPDSRDTAQSRAPDSATLRSRILVDELSHLVKSQNGIGSPLRVPRRGTHRLKCKSSPNSIAGSHRPLMKEVLGSRKKSSPATKTIDSQ